MLLCSNQTASYTFDYKQTGSTTTNFSPIGIPAGANYSISPTSLSSNGTVTLTVSNLPAVTPGEYSVESLEIMELKQKQELKF